jgi:branched-chain amino acid transport system ATP-binding protein
MNLNTLLEIKDLFCGYGRIEVLRSINIRLGEGELLALIGANGAGKTTLLKAIIGILKPTRGAILYKSKNILKNYPFENVKLGISLVPEGRHVFSHLSVEDNLVLGGFTRSKREIIEDIEKQYTLFPILKEKRRELAGMLSGGQQQMLAIGRALMARPKVLLLDEPSMGLAPLLVAEIFRIVLALRDQGVTILIVEQNAHGALGIADRAYVLETGRLAFEGKSSDFLSNEAIKKAYLGV